MPLSDRLCSGEGVKSVGGVSQRNDGHLGMFSWMIGCRGVLASCCRWTCADDRHLQALMGPWRGRGAASTRRPGGDHGRSAGICGLRVTAAAAEQVSVVVATELATEKVQRERIDARVDERQTVGKDLEDVPEHVVLGRVEVVPEVPDVTRQPADDEHQHEGQHETCHLLTSFHLQRHRKLDE